MQSSVISGTETASDEGVADTADTSVDSVSETDMDAKIVEADYMDTGFMNACNMLPDIVALPVCV